MEDLEWPTVSKSDGRYNEFRRTRILAACRTIESENAHEEVQELFQKPDRKRLVRRSMENSALVQAKRSFSFNLSVSPAFQTILHSPLKSRMIQKTRKITRGGGEGGAPVKARERRIRPFPFPFPFQGLGF